jgi:TolA-binding protein
MREPKRWSSDEQAPTRSAEFLRSLKRAEPPSPEKLEQLARRLSALSASAGAAALVPFAVKAAAAAGALAGGVMLAVAVTGTGSPQQPASPPATVTLTTAAARSTGEALDVTPPRSPAVAPLSSAAAAAPRRRPPPAAVASVARAPRDTLAEEEQLLETARGSMAAAPAQALKALDQHQRRFPNGELTPERLYLSAEASRRLGDRAGARVKAQRLVRAYPRSVYAERLATLLGAPP